jgi:prophage regulatory protein
MQIMSDIKTNNQKILRLRAVKDWTGLSRSTIYAMMKSHSFPQNIQLGLRSVGWLDSDIDAWIDSKVAASKAVA